MMHEFLMKFAFTMQNAIAFSVWASRGHCPLSGYLARACMVPGVKREVLYGHVSQVLVDLVVCAVHAMLEDEHQCTMEGLWVPY